MMYALNNTQPIVGENCFVAPSADVIGSVILGNNVSVWFNTTIRGDDASISIGDNTNVQDNSLIHADGVVPTVIGINVTIAHSTVVHACTIGDDCMIGIGAVVLTGAVIGSGSLVAAGSLVKEHQIIPPNSIAMGRPVSIIKPITEELSIRIRNNAQHYRRTASIYLNGLKPIV
jgi:carbonic anhydrase/acetyltransferase-like protein (isoleucine patch superfamily)